MHHKISSKIQFLLKKMNSLTHSTPTLLQPQNHKLKNSIAAIKAPNSSQESNAKAKISSRRIFLTANTIIATSVGNGIFRPPPPAAAENWGVRSFLWERFFEPDLSPEDSAARIRQTAEGLHSIREMLETMSWRYVIFYIRLKQAYLSKDLKIAMSTLPKAKWKHYVDLANDLVENMARFDQYVRSPKVYESYLYYEKTLKSIDDIVAYLA